MMMDDRQVEQIVSQAVSKAVPHTVKETLLSLGFDTSSPAELQKDALFLRQFRKTCQEASNKAIMLIVAIAVAALVGGVWMAVKKALSV